MKPIYLLFGAAALYFITKSSTGVNNAASQRQALVNWANTANDTPENNARAKDIFSRLMTDAEIYTAYTYIFEYFIKGMQVPQDSSLYSDIRAISEKYNIFT